MAAVSAGDVLGDRYTLKRQEWESVLGPVWLARDRVLDRPVLVQLLGSRAAADPDATRTFLRAAAGIAQVTHHGLLRVFDIGTDPAFAVVEHASGGRLADRLRSGPLRPTDAARAAIAVARGLEALHERGTWHGSLSPSTVLFDEEGRAKILALGAAEVGETAEAVDATAAQAPGYRPAEPGAAPADADRYALAALLYEMLTGRAPERPPASPRSVRRSIPAEMDALVMRALSEDPGARPSLDSFVGALAGFARVIPAAARQPRPRASEFRWLVPVVLILVIGGVAATVGVQLVRELAERADRAPPASPTPTTGQALTIADAGDFDPEGDGEEHREQVGRATDGDPRTAWATVGYVSERLGGGKTGVGLLFDLGEITVVRRVRLQTTAPGWTGEIRIAEQEGDAASDYEVAAEFTAATDTDIGLPGGTRGRYLLVWITRLVDDGGGSEFPFRAAIAEVEAFAA